MQLYSDHREVNLLILWLHFILSSPYVRNGQKKNNTIQVPKQITIINLIFY